MKTRNNLIVLSATLTAFLLISSTVFGANTAATPKMLPAPNVHEYINSCVPDVDDDAQTRKWKETIHSIIGTDAREEDTQVCRYDAIIRDDETGFMLYRFVTLIDHPIFKNYTYRDCRGIMSLDHNGDTNPTLVYDDFICSVHTVIKTTYDKVIANLQVGISKRR